MDPRSHRPRTRTGRRWTRIHPASIPSGGSASRTSRMTAPNPNPLPRTRRRRSLPTRSRGTPIAKAVGRMQPSFLVRTPSKTSYGRRLHGRVSSRFGYVRRVGALPYAKVGVSGDMLCAALYSSVRRRISSTVSSNSRRRRSLYPMRPPIRTPPSDAVKAIISRKMTAGRRGSSSIPPS
jgi:hypothetical protein